MRATYITKQEEKNQEGTKCTVTEYTTVSQAACHSLESQATCKMPEVKAKFSL